MVGGTVSGLAGSGLVLQNNAGDELAIAADGRFAFATTLVRGASYAVTIKALPHSPAQRCRIEGDSGSVANAPVTGILVHCVTSTARFAYLGYYNKSDIEVYGFDAATGALAYRSSTPTGAGTATPGGQTGAVVVTPGDRFAYASHPASGRLSAYAIDAATGALTPVAGSPFTAPPDVVALAAAPSGRFVYGVSYTTNQLLAFALDADTGALSSTSATPVASGPRSIALSASGRFAYVANGNGTLSTFALDTTTGVATEVAGGAVPAGSNPMAVALAPTGRFAYVADYLRTPARAYTLQAGTGVPALLANQTWVSGLSAALTVDPSGRFLYVANASTMSAYAIDGDTGALTPVSGSAASGLSSPVSITVDPTGRFAYVVDFAADQLQSYAIDAATGALSPLATITAPGFPISLVIGEP
jgi:6-phosphogluconolactonase (cycloisomerase 2 family)